MANYTNMSDAELLSILNSMADKFEQGQALVDPVKQEPNLTETVKTDEFNFETSTGTIQPDNSSVYTEPKPEPVAPVQPDPVTPVQQNDLRWEDREIELEDVPGKSCSMYSEPEQDMPVINPVYTMDKDGNIVFSNMRPTQQNNAFRITPEKAIIADYGFLKFVEKRRKTLFESEFGISYSYKKSWEALLESIVREFKDARAVNNFGIRDGLILAKNLEVDPQNFTDDKLGITLYDLIDFHVLFKELPNIEKLVLDPAATERMVIIYGDKASDIWKVFQESPSLRVLRIHTSTGWKDHNRSDFGATANELEKELQESRVRAELQYKFDVTNPRKSEMTKGYAYRVKENAKEMRKHSFGIAKEAFMAPQPKLDRKSVV